MRVLIAIILLLSPLAAAAQGFEPPEDRETGWFASLSGGTSILFDQTSTSADAGELITDFAAGFAVGGRVGYAFSPFDSPVGRIRLRAALDHTYRQNRIGTPGILNGDGDNSSNSFMALGIIEWTNAFGTASPYIGAGVGVAGVESDQFADLDGDGVADLEFGGTVDALLAYQGLIGLTFPITEGIDIFGEFRFSATSSPTFDLIELDSDAVLGSFDSEYDLIHAVIGIRYNF